MSAAITPAPADGDFSVFDYLGILRRRWLWVLLPIVLACVAVFWNASRQTDRYVSSARVLLADTAAQRTLDPSSQNPWYLTRQLSNEISLAQSDLVKDMIEAELGEIPEVDIEVEETSDVLVFTAEADDAATAARNAQLWAETYVQVKQQEAVSSVTGASARLQVRLEEIRAERQELRGPLDRLEDRILSATTPEQAARLQLEYDRLESDLRYELDLLTAQAEAVAANLADLDLQAELATVGEARIAQAAFPPTERSNPPLSRNLALGLVAGLLAGVVLALLMEFRDNTIKKAADLTASTGLPVLATIPKAPKDYLDRLAVATAADSQSIYADGYQKLRAAVEFMAQSDGVKSVLITSAKTGEGKSTTASNLSLALSTVARRTILLDADFRRGRVHEIFDVPAVPGLSDYILYRPELSQVAHAPDSGNDHLFVIPSGSMPPNPVAFIGSPQYRKAVDWLTTNADAVILDGPPLLAVADVYTLAQQVDAVILTVMAGKTTKSQLAEMITSLNQVNAKILGAVLIGVKDADNLYGDDNYYRAKPEGGRKRMSLRREVDEQYLFGDLREPVTPRPRNGNGHGGNGSSSIPPPISVESETAPRSP